MRRVSVSATRPLSFRALLCALAVVLLFTGTIAVPGAAAAPANDDFANAQVLSGATATLSGDTIGGSVEPSEPALLTGDDRRSVWFRWTATASGPATLLTCRSGLFNIGIGVSTGSALASLTRVATGSASLGDAGGGSCLWNETEIAADFTATAGTTYRIALETSAEVGFRLALNPPPGNDALAQAQPLARSAGFNTIRATSEAGEPVHGGVASSRTVWFNDQRLDDVPGVPIRLTTCGSAFDTVLSVYKTTGTGFLGLTSVQSNDDSAVCGAGSKQSAVTFTPEPGAVYAFAVSGHGDVGGLGRINVSPSNDDLASARVFDEDFYTRYGAYYGGGMPFTTIGATAEAGEPAHGGVAPARTVWVTLTPSRIATYALDTCGADFDTRIALYRRTGAGFAGLVPVTSNDDAPACGGDKGSRVTFRPGAVGESYLLAIDGEAGATGSGQLHIASNDDRRDALDITATGSFATYAGWTAGSTREAGEPNHAGAGAPGSLWFAYRPATSGPVGLGATGGCFVGPITGSTASADVALAVYMEGAGGALTEVAQSDDSGIGGCPTDAAVTFTASAGVRYLIAVVAKRDTPASITLSLNTAPANDAMSGAESLPAAGASGAFGRTDLASREPGEPLHAGVTTGGSLWFKYEPTTTEWVTLETCPASSGASPILYDTVLAVYEGSTVSTLTEVTSNDDAVTTRCSAGTGSRLSRVRFQAVAGHIYRIAVAGKGADGGVSLWRQGVPSNDRRINASYMYTGYNVLGTTELATAETGEPEHAGRAAAHSVWYRASLAAGRYSLSTCELAAAGVRLAVYPSTGSTTAALASARPSSTCAGGRGARLTFTLTSSQTVDIAVDADGADTGDFRLVLRWLQQAGNDHLAGASYVSDPAWSSDASATYQGQNTYDATREPGEPDHAGAGGGASVWYSFNPSQAGLTEIDVCDATFDTALAVYERTGSGFAGLTEVEAVNDSASCANPKAGRLQFSAAAGKTYLIAVDGREDEKGEFTLTVRRRPANDDFSPTMYAYETLTTSGSTVLAGAQAGEPAHAGASAQHSVWFALTARGRLSIDTCGSSFDTRLAVYTGSSLATLTRIAENDDASDCGTGGSRIEVRTGSTQKLWVAIDGKGGAVGTYRLTTGPGNDDFADASATQGDSLGIDLGTLARATAETGEPAHDGSPAASSIWYRWTPTRTGLATLSSCTPSGKAPRLAIYTGSSLTSLTAVAPSATPGCPAGQVGKRVRVPVTGFTTYRVAVDAAPGGGDGSSYSVFVGLAPQNDTPAEASLLRYDDEQVYGATHGATHDAGEENHGSAAGDASVWFRFDANVERDVVLDLCSGTYWDTVLVVYDRAANGTLTKVAENDDGGTGCYSGASKVRWHALQDHTYLIALDGKGKRTGSYWGYLRLAPSNDDMARPRTVVTGGEYEDSTRWADLEAEEPSHAPGASSSVWYRFVAPRSGPVVMNTCGASSQTVLAAYSGTPGSLVRLASDTEGARCGSGDGGSRISFTAVKDAAYLIAVAADRDSTGSFRLRVDPPANDDFEDASALTGGPLSVTQSAGAARSQPGEPGTGDGASSVWFRWTASTTGKVELNTCASDATLRVYTGTSVSGLTERGTKDTRACRGDVVELDAVAGTAYMVRVAGYGIVRLQVAPPGNDQVASPVTLTGARDTATGTTAGASADDSDPYDSGNRSVWFSWTAPDQGEVLVDVCDSDVPITVRAYRRGTDGTLGPPAAAPAPGACAESEKGAKAAFAAVKNATYLIAVSATGTETGGFDLVLDALFDTDPPETTITTEPEALTNAYSVSFAFSSDEPGSTFQCSVDGGTYTTCTSPRTVFPAEGSRKFAVRAIDRAGNVDPTPAESRYVVDRTPPVVTITGGPPELGNETSATLTFTVNETGATAMCSLDDAESAACTSPVTKTGLTDGSHHFAVHAVDGAGNVGGTKFREFTVDTIPPVTTFGDGPGAFTKERSGTVAFTANEADSTFACALDEAEFASCTSLFTFSDLADGEHTIRVRATDPAGNVEAPAVERVFTVDTQPPDTVLDSGPRALSSEQPTVEFHSPDETASFECALDEEDYAPCSSPHSRSVADGAHVLRVRAVDTAGNVDATPVESRFTVDTTPPTVVVDREPPSTTAARTVSLTFHASEAGATFECATDGAALAACTSPYTTPDLADEGEHSIRVRAIDAAGNVGPTTDRTILVDRVPPETEISGHPGEFTNLAEVSFSFTSNEPGTFECRIDAAAFAACEATTAFASVAEGKHTLEVRAVDAAGTKDPTPAKHTFEVDRTAPRTRLTWPTGAIHGRLRVGIAANETATFECALDSDDWVGCPDDGDFRVPGAGSHTLKVRATDRAGNVETPPVTKAFTSVNVEPEATLAVSPDHGARSLDVEATFSGADADGDDLTYRLSFGDDSGEHSGSLPAGPIAHTYRKTGAYQVRLEISDGGSSTVKTAVVAVEEPEPLVAAAGDDLIATAGQPVVFDGGASRPAGLIDRYRWDFGDGGSGTGSTVSHTYASPGTYTAKLTTERDEDTATDEATVVVREPDPTGLRVKVTGGGGALPGATALIIRPDGTRQQATADGEGVATIQSPPEGASTVYVWASGYLPKTAKATVTRGSGTLEVALDEGEAGAATLESRRMTLEEIRDAGIDLADPDNYHVYEAKIHLYFDKKGVTELPVYVTPEGLRCIGECPTGTGGGGGGGGGGSTGGAPCAEADTLIGCWALNGYQFLPSITYVNKKPVIHWLVLPMRASFLKEFFNVQMVIQNVAPGFTFEPGVAKLQIPGGLSLAPLPTPQRATQAVPAIPGGQSRSASWILRGDTQGEYDLTANYSSAMAPIGEAVNLTAQTRKPLKVWGAGALRTRILADPTIARWAPYTVDVEVTNTTDTSDDPAPVYNLQVEMLDGPEETPEGEAQFYYAPSPQAQGVDELKPGQTETFSYTVFAGVGDEDYDETDFMDLILERSFIERTGGDVDLDPKLCLRRASYSATGATDDKGCPLAGADASDPSTSLTARPVDIEVKRDGGRDGAYVSFDKPRGERAGATIVGYELWSRQDGSPGPWTPVEVPITMTAGGGNAVIPSSMRALGRYLTVGTKYSDGKRLFQHFIGEGPARYVALGDSFSSGEGVPQFEADTDMEDDDRTPDVNEHNLCHRAFGSYSRLLASDPEVDGVLEPVEYGACSGAVAADIDEPGFGKDGKRYPNPKNPGEPKLQLDRVNEFTDVISLSMGGNDIDFSGVIKTCLLGMRSPLPLVRVPVDCDLAFPDISLGSESWVRNLVDFGNDLDDAYSEVKEVAEITACQALRLTSPMSALWCAWKAHNAYGAATNLLNFTRRPDTTFLYGNRLRDRLVRVYEALARRAPNATIFVQPYPQVVYDAPGAGDKSCGLLGPGWPDLTAGDRRGVRTIQTLLNTEISRAVVEANGNLPRSPIRLVRGVHQEFKGHELCRNGELNPDTYFNSLVNPVLGPSDNLGPLSYAFHPNKFGQEAYAQALKAELNDGIARGIVTVQPRETVDGGSVFVPRDSPRLHAEVAIPGSKVTLSLISPSGAVYGESTPGVNSTRTPTTHVLEISDPEQGTWKIRVFGDDVMEDGEPVQIDAAAELPQVPPPVVTANATRVSGSTYDVEATGPAGAQHEWLFSDGKTALGAKLRHTFPDGDTDLWATVTTTAADGQVAITPLSIVTSDTAPPVFSDVPADITVDASGASGAAVSFTRPTARDARDGQVDVTCDREPDTVFPVGTTTVTCTASDDAGNRATVSFQVTVKAPAGAGGGGGGGSGGGSSGGGSAGGSTGGSGGGNGGGSGDSNAGGGAGADVGGSGATLTPGGGTGVGTGTSGASAFGKVSVGGIIKIKRLRTAGLRVEIAGVRKGARISAVLVLKRGKKSVAVARRTLTARKAGKHVLVLKPGAKARRSLKVGQSLTLVVSAVGAKPVSRRVRVTK